MLESCSESSFFVWQHSLEVIQEMREWRPASMTDLPFTIGFQAIKLLLMCKSGYFSLFCLGFGVLSAHAALPFERQVIDAEISIGYGLAIGDVDGDKKPDILLADKSQAVWYRNGDWKRFVMTENINPRVVTRFLDNVCIAARDIDGDGKVEVALGANWNPGETTDKAKSGSVHILERPDDPTKRWGSKKLDHLPTVHRMHFVKSGKGFELQVLPLHGLGNRGGAGEAVKMLHYSAGDWKMVAHDIGLHATHNFDVAVGVVASGEGVIVGGKEGVIFWNNLKQEKIVSNPLSRGVGEVRIENRMVATIEPMHGNEVVVYHLPETGSKEPLRTSLDATLDQGHALAIADLDGDKKPEVLAGWRGGKGGIRIYTQSADGWKTEALDDGGIACEDLKVADLNGDGKPDVIAAGRGSKNVVIYWNKSK